MQAKIVTRGPTKQQKTQLRHRFSWPETERTKNNDGDLFSVGRKRKTKKSRCEVISSQYRSMIPEVLLAHDKFCSPKNARLKKPWWRLIFRRSSYITIKKNQANAKWVQSHSASWFQRSSQRSRLRLGLFIRTSRFRIPLRVIMVPDVSVCYKSWLCIKNCFCVIQMMIQIWDDDSSLSEQPEKLATKEKEHW